MPLKPDAIPRNLVPMEGPAGEPILELVLDGSGLTIVARLNGKNYRKMLKNIAEHGEDNVRRGPARGNPAQGGKLYLEGAGFQVNVKSPPPAPARQAAESAASNLSVPGATDSPTLA